MRSEGECVEDVEEREVKARMRHWNGKWWCRRMGVTGCGDTMEEAWDDMWALYREAVTPKITLYSRPVRA